MVKASIIIVSYNGLEETTALCLQSIFSQTSHPAYEVIVVDNNSSDGTQEYLKSLAEREPRLRLVLNTSNRGFAGGNNDGIRAANGDFLVLLNSDTLVTVDWLPRLVNALEKDCSIGLVGPVSNAVGNEQKIYTSGTTVDEILAEGLKWSEMSKGDAFDTERLGFFCVALRRDVLKVVGFLDEAYDLGFYEDDDFCIRVSKAGYRLVCLEDVFVYHRGSASFKKAPKATKELLKKNRKLLEAKFNLRYRPSHPRDRQLALVESYLASLGNFLNDARLVEKINNRMHILDGLMPKGLFKRIIFKKRLREITTHPLLAGRLPRFGG
jgi:GT2 family glycosyltransferase